MADLSIRAEAAYDAGDVVKRPSSKFDEDQFLVPAKFVESNSVCRRTKWVVGQGLNLAAIK